MVEFHVRWLHQMVPEDLLYLIVESVGRTPAASLVSPGPYV